MSDWGDDEEDALQLIRTTRCEEDLESAFRRLRDVNVFHRWRNASFSLAFHISLWNNLPAMRAILRCGHDPAVPNGTGTTVLKLLVKREQMEMAQSCLDAIPDPDRRLAFVNGSSGPGGWTVLMGAAEHGSLKAVKWLLENGASPNAAMTTGWTAAHAAAKKGHYQILELLLEHGADMDMRASHRDFGRDLAVEDVTADESIVGLLRGRRNGVDGRGQPPPDPT